MWWVLLVLACSDHKVGETAPELRQWPADSGTASDTLPSDRDGDGSAEPEDCDDSDAEVHPGAEELADGLDQDCDGTIDEGTEAYDDDGDGYSENAGDCDDEDASAFPGAVEIADGVDQDCDGRIDEGTEAYDDDGDGWSEIDGDCDDGDASVSPDAAEIVDGLDQDCDGRIDDETEVYDDDGDGFAEIDGDCDDGTPEVAPDVDEVEGNGVDDDCDGLLDEEGDRYLDADHYLIQSDEDGLQILNHDLSVAASYPFTSLIGGSCDASCFGEGTSTDPVDPDRTLGVFVTNVWSFDGGIYGVSHAGALQFSLEGFVFPHDVERDPNEGSLIVGEAFGSVVWVAGDGSSNSPIREMNAWSTPGFEGTITNGLDILEYDGTTWLLVCTRDGVLTMWDISDPDSPTRAWRYPAAGSLDTPHGAVIREYDGQFWLLYAHTYGGPGFLQGSVGAAVLAHPADPPAYVADLDAPAGFPPFGFLRGVELSTDGILYVTDAGTEFPDSGARGTLLEATLPAGMTPPGTTGAAGPTQVFVEMPDLVERMSGLGTPFESRISRIP